jgi:CheY-like chemotaxis protein
MAKILVVDDDLHMRDLIKTFMSDSGYQIETACDGHEALGKISHWKPDLVITDYEMPHINGVTLTEVIKAELGLPVILLSGICPPDNQADIFLLKPFSFFILLEAVETLIEPEKKLPYNKNQCPDKTSGLFLF